MEHTMHSPQGAGITSADDMSSKRDGVAGALDKVANRLHNVVDGKKDGMMSGIADRTANALDATGKYVRDMNTKDIMKDLTEVAKNHPGKSLIAAMVVGLLVGRSITTTRS